MSDRAEGRYWTNEDGTTGYEPFTDDNFDDCQHCGCPHSDEVEIVQGEDSAIVYLHPECEGPYRLLWGDKIIISTTEVLAPFNPDPECPFCSGKGVTSYVVPDCGEISGYCEQAMDELKDADDDAWFRGD